MGMDQQIGSLEMGKQADIIAIDLSGPECQPLYNPLSQLVYACNGHQVNHSWVAGAKVLKDGAPTHINTKDLLARTAAWQSKISSND